MATLGNLKLKTRIFLGYFPSVLILLILSGVTYSYVLDREKLNEEIEVAQNTVFQAQQTALGISRMVRALRGQVIDPSDPHYQEGYEKGLQAFQQASAELIPLLDDPATIEQMNTVLVQAEEVQEVAGQIITLSKAGQFEESKGLVTTIILDEMDTTVRGILDQEVAALEEKKLEGEASKKFLLNVVLASSAIATAITALLGFLIASGISRKVQQSVGDITTSSNEIATTVEEQERVAHQQAASVNETTTTMDELEASFRQSAEQAKAAAAAAKRALELTEGGNLAVGENLEGMFMLEKKVGTIAEQMLQLSEQAQQIGSISQLVSDIASQTNMLALNSSVEAVRAGEHGKGFTVVANEIRKLADQSQRSADKINELVSQIQNAINSTVMVTEEGTKTVSTGVDIARRTEQAFTGAADAVNQVVLNNQQISLNLKQQLDGIQQIVQAMETINQGAKETASGITQAKVGTQQLNETALTLKRLV
ncbi:methyl-accepting chemotaxis protein [Oculatella sp. FACHB-28]|uniref:methyl-accepting chemotaxis protein n=1 Tax=Oculatella sp. FACHB-28 TaxID=2692845 RepID=UPI001F54A3FD|nr:methyl-accepting chemotaxis protein [Oculatella sp. FACHB-28]